MVLWPEQPGMSEPGVETTLRPRRRWRRFAGAVVLCVLSLFTALMLWAARPRYYTFVSKPLPASPPMALVIQVPYGWECKYAQDMTGGLGFTVNLSRKPPAGFARWWDQYILHLSHQSPIEQFISAYVQDEDNEDDDVLPDAQHRIQSEAEADKNVASRLGDTITVHKVKHSLGSALEITATGSTIYAGSGRFIGISDGTLQNVHTFICTIQKHRYAVYVEANQTRRTSTGHDMDSTWNEIVRSIRVVQK